MEPVLDLRDYVRTIPDYPRAGIQFRDITTLLGHAGAMRHAVEHMSAPFRSAGITHVVGIEARGFILGGAVAVALEAAFVPLRKPGKLPHVTTAQTYELEYGTDALEMHIDALSPDCRVLIVDDLIATGGTALAAVTLARRSGAEVTGAAFVIDLPELGGLQRVAEQGVRAEALIAFDGH